MEPVTVDALLTLIRKAVGSLVQDGGIQAPKGALDLLYGEGGFLDSLGLVTVLLEVERLVEERYGVSITLADDRALSSRASPFRSVDSLAAYVHDRVIHQ